MKNPLIFLLALFLAHAATAQETCLTHHPSDDRYASYSPDGEWIIFESNRDDHWAIYLMDKTGEQVQKLTQNEQENRRPTWHPGGKKILFESIRNGAPELFTLNLKNRKEKKLSISLEKGEMIFASYSPNGKYIAVSLKESEEKSNLILLTKKGKWIRDLTQNERRNYYPKWSPDGTGIIYFSRKDTDNEDDEIYRLNLESGVHTRLTNWHKHNFCPTFSADGQQIAYVTSMEDSRPEIYIMDREGNKPTRITYNENGETLPCWHPFENKLLLTAYRNGKYEICELELTEK